MTRMLRLSCLRSRMGGLPIAALVALTFLLGGDRAGAQVPGVGPSGCRSGSDGEPCADDSAAPGTIGQLLSEAAENTTLAQRLLSAWQAELNSFRCPGESNARQIREQAVAMASEQAELASTNRQGASRSASPEWTRELADRQTTVAGIFRQVASVLDAYMTKQGACAGGAAGNAGARARTGDSRQEALAANTAAIRAQRKDDHEEALRLFTRAHELSGGRDGVIRRNLAAAQNKMGWLAFQEGDLDAAERWHRLSLETEPGDEVVQGNLAAVWNRRGVAAYNSGDLTAAERWFTSALEMDPDNATMRDNLNLAIREGRARQEMARGLDQLGERFGIGSGAPTSGRSPGLEFSPGIVTEAPPAGLDFALSDAGKGVNLQRLALDGAPEPVDAPAADEPAVPAPPPTALESAAATGLRVVPEGARGDDRLGVDLPGEFSIGTLGGEPASEEMRKVFDVPGDRVDGDLAVQLEEFASGDFGKTPEVIRAIQERLEGDPSYQALLDEERAADERLAGARSQLEVARQEYNRRRSNGEAEAALGDVAIRIVNLEQAVFDDTQVKLAAQVNREEKEREAAASVTAESPVAPPDGDDRPVSRDEADDRKPDTEVFETFDLESPRESGNGDTPREPAR